MTSPTATRPRAAWIIGGIVLLVTALVAGAVATTHHEGAATPTEALDEFFDALDHATVTDLLAILPPAEAEALADTLPALGEELARLGLVANGSGDATLGLEVTRPEVTLVPLEDWMIRAELDGGTLARRSDGDGGTVLTDDGVAAVERVLGIDLPGSEPEVLGDRWPQLMLYRDGGGWRVSPAITVAEQWRLDEGLPEPTWGEGSVAVGSDDPTEAVTDIFGAIANGDAGRIQSIMAPEETIALYQYTPLALPFWQEDFLRIREREGFWFQVDEIDVTVTGEGPRRTAQVTGYTGSFGDPTARVDLRYADGCLSITTTWAPTGDEEPTVTSEERCDGELHEAGPDVGPWSDLLAHTALGRAFPTFSVVEHHGRWFVSPTRTLLGTLTEVAAGLEPDQADELVTALAAAWPGRGGVAPTTGP